MHTLEIRLRETMADTHADNLLSRDLGPTAAAERRAARLRNIADGVLAEAMGESMRVAGGKAKLKRPVKPGARYIVKLKSDDFVIGIAHDGNALVVEMDGETSTQRAADWQSHFTRYVGQFKELTTTEWSCSNELAFGM